MVITTTLTKTGLQDYSLLTRSHAGSQSDFCFVCGMRLIRLCNGCCSYNKLHVACSLPATEQAELEDLMKKWVLRRTKAIIASQLPKKGNHTHTHTLAVFSDLPTSGYMAHNHGDMGPG